MKGEIEGECLAKKVVHTFIPLSRQRKMFTGLKVSTIGTDLFHVKHFINDNVK